VDIVQFLSDIPEPAPGATSTTSAGRFQRLY
jgi:hypothetical protein